MKNVKCFGVSTSVRRHVPQFLRNQPALLLKHCLDRMLPTIDDIPSSQIATIEPGVWLVQSRVSSLGYIVQKSSQRDSNVPSCDCFDWQLRGLPCWHMVGMLTCPGTSCSWNSPQYSYRHIPQINVIINLSLHDYWIILHHFWATTCKTVRPMLSDRCLSVLSCLSVTFVYCGQMVVWIKMKRGMQVGLGPATLC